MTYHRTTETQSPSKPKPTHVPETLRPDEGNRTGSPPLAPKTVMYLQRTVGNQAVQRVIQQTASEQRLSIHPTTLRRIQRALPDAAEFTDLSKTVEAAVDTYNKLPKPKEAEDYQEAFNALQAVDRAVHGWFDSYTKTHERFGKDTDVAKMKDLLAKAEEEHVALIQSAKNLEEVLPFDPTGLDNSMVSAMKTLWQDIVNNRGKIKLVGDDPFNQLTLSHLGKILSTPTGRQMMSFLNAPPPGKHETESESELTNIYIGQQVDQLPETVRNASPMLQDMGRAEAQPLNIDDMSGRTIENMTAVKEEQFYRSGIWSYLGYGAPNEEQFPTVDNDHLGVVRDSAWGGKQGYTVGDKKYTFNREKGTGAFVTNVTDQSAHPAKGTGNEILSPTWITLGHELGHAANMRAGATTLTTNSLMSLGGTDPNAEKWDNPEELLNIENVENALRSEAGLTERFGHRPPDWLLKVAPKVRSKLLVPLNALIEKDNKRWNFDNPKFDAICKRIRTLKAELTVEPSQIDKVGSELLEYLKDDAPDQGDIQLLVPTAVENAKKEIA